MRKFVKIFPKILMWVLFGLSLIVVGLFFLGGSLLAKPLSVDMVVVTRKKMRSKKAISAIELALISCTSLFPIFLIYNAGTRVPAFKFINLSV